MPTKVKQKFPLPALTIMRKIATIVALYYNNNVSILKHQKL